MDDDMTEAHKRNRGQPVRLNRPDHEGDESGRCGGCGSRNMLTSRDSEHALCLDCERLQEPETRDWPAILIKLCTLPPVHFARED